MKIQFNSLILFTFLAAMGLWIHAPSYSQNIENGQYRFGIKKFSNGLSCMDMNVTSSGVDLSVKKNDVTHKANFICEPDSPNSRLACYSPDGHGDFYLDGAPKRPRVQFIYINLGPHEPDVEITEEFSLENKKPRSTGHNNYAQMIGFPGHCDSSDH